MMNLEIIKTNPFTYFRLNNVFNKHEVESLLSDFPDNLANYVSDSYSKFRIENATIEMWRIKRKEPWKKALQKFLQKT